VSNHNWYTNKEGTPKTHSRASTCPACRKSGGKGGCMLPFRKSSKKRFLARLENRPLYQYRLDIIKGLFWKRLSKEFLIK
jgi:hypothetical protein